MAPTKSKSQIDEYYVYLKNQGLKDYDAYSQKSPADQLDWDFYKWDINNKPKTDTDEKPILLISGDTKIVVGRRRMKNHRYQIDCVYWHDNIFTNVQLTHPSKHRNDFLEPEINTVYFKGTMLKFGNQKLHMNFIVNQYHTFDYVCSNCDFTECCCFPKSQFESEPLNCVCSKCHYDECNCSTTPQFESNPLDCCDKHCKCLHGKYYNVHYYNDIIEGNSVYNLLIEMLDDDGKVTDKKTLCIFNTDYDITADSTNINLYDHHIQIDGAWYRIDHVVKTDRTIKILLVDGIDNVNI
jgi:hypothetical protein